MIIVLVLWSGVAWSARTRPDETYYSDRFIFLGNNIDTPVLMVVVFNRGRSNQKNYGEFIGALFDRGVWNYLEGSDLYPYPQGRINFSEIRPSYYARVTGSPTAGFRLHYDGGDATVTLASGPFRPHVTDSRKSYPQSKMGQAEALLALRGKNFWGRMIHTSEVWPGLDGLKQHRDLYKTAYRFYLILDAGPEIRYIHKNQQEVTSSAHTLVRLPREHTLRFYQNPQNPQDQIDSLEGNVAITPLEIARLWLGLFSVPERWRVEIPSKETLDLWSRGRVRRGGRTRHYLMAIEGLINRHSGQQRVWGLLEYLP